MKVFKFGGASIKDADSIKNVVQIITKNFADNPLVVISAAGKTTNALEKVVKEYIAEGSKVLDYLNEVKDYHYEIIDQLFEDKNHPVFLEIDDMFIDVCWILESSPVGGYDQIYDQIVSLGELLSSKIVASYLDHLNIDSQWLDVRDCILTDNNYRDAGILWEETEKKINRIVPDLMKKGIVVTQGFIGITTENFTTTLGREGSDYSAAIFSYCLNAESMTIWKDVDGVLNADPRIFSKVTLLDKISYQEAIEMTYYGAQVIHPKTLRPLQNKNIALFVKSFLHPVQNGTIVSAVEYAHYPPVFVVKPNQVLLKISSKSFHFIDEIRFANLFEAFAKFKIKVNMTQNTALAFSVAVNFDESRITELTNYLSNEYDVEMIEQLKLLTIRHGNEEIVQKISDGKIIYLEEKIKGNVQLLMKENEILE